MGVPPACHVPRPATLAKRGHPCTLCINSNMHPLAWPLLLQGLANTLLRPHCVYLLNLFVLYSYLSKSKYLGSFYGSVSWSSPHHAAFTFSTRTIGHLTHITDDHRNNRYGYISKFCQHLTGSQGGAFGYSLGWGQSVASPIIGSRVRGSRVQSAF